MRPAAISSNVTASPPSTTIDSIKSFAFIAILRRTDDPLTHGEIPEASADKRTGRDQLHVAREETLNVGLINAMPTPRSQRRAICNASCPRQTRASHGRAADCEAATSGRRSSGGSLASHRSAEVAVSKLTHLDASLSNQKKQMTDSSKRPDVRSGIAHATATAPHGAFSVSFGKHEIGGTCIATALPDSYRATKWT
jgi:hypothetical protein